jgi:glucan 1,3-beta-glucosidase
LYANNSVPDGDGEWQFSAVLGPDKAAAVLSQHHAEWFTCEDQRVLKSAGFTHLRIPIGYWILGSPFIAPGEPYVAVGWPALMAALVCAKSIGLSVLVDLHGAPGSQNGHDNSGKSGGVIEWNTPSNQARTIAVLEELARNLTIVNAQPETAGVVVAIETLNEPWTTQVNGPIVFTDLAAWYTSATIAMRSAGWTGDIYHHDGFSPANEVWRGFLAPPAFTGIILDTHQYFCFGGYDSLSPWGVLGTVCTKTGPGLQNLTDRDWLVVGEWSLSVDDAISPALPSADGNFFYRAFAEAQLDAWGSLGPAPSTPKGSYFWCHRTESSLPWSALDGLRLGLFPNFTETDAARPSGRLTCDGFGVGAMGASPVG